MFMRTSIRNAKSVVRNRCNEHNAGVRGCSQDFRFKTCEWKVLSHRPKIFYRCGTGMSLARSGGGKQEIMYHRIACHKKF